ncbi:hypothetical protein [Enterococcus massiliensis]|uniref:hypothetical protein n=1 Tax=Enterococcus massiliensis TaxID=1640685 RepID=UPI00065E3057|nr:hypothetical protein [Enterococcus massiliensis]
MKKLKTEPENLNDIPVIFVYNQYGQIAEKISINEWRRRKEQEKEIENFEIRLYREALNYYGQKEFEKAEDLLTFLVARTNYTHYEYVERLANIYRQEKRTSKERTVLLLARRSLLATEDFDGVIRRIDKRLHLLGHPLDKSLGVAFQN